MPSPSDPSWDGSAAGSDEPPAYDRPQVCMKSRPPDLVLRGASQGYYRKDSIVDESPAAPTTNDHSSRCLSPQTLAALDRAAMPGVRRGFRKLLDEFESKCLHYFAGRDHKVKEEVMNLRLQNRHLVSEIRRLCDLAGEEPPEFAVEGPVEDFQYQFSSEFSQQFGLQVKPRNTSGEDYQVMLNKARDVLQAWCKKVTEKRMSGAATKSSRFTNRTVGERISSTSSNASQESGRVPSGDYDLLPFWKDLENIEKADGSFDGKPQLRSQWTGLEVQRRGSLPMALNYSHTHNLNQHHLSMNPLSKHQLLWQFIGVSLIFFDLVTIPLQVFEPTWRAFFVGSLWVTNTYWTLDVVMTFFVAFHKNGELVFGMYEIAKHYVTTWFIPDVSLVSCDMTLLVYEMSDDTDIGNIGYVKVGRTLRILRFARLVRLIKLRRFFDFFDSIMAQISSEYLLTAARITKLIIFILICTHLLACAWYGLGLWLETNYSLRSWLQKSFEDDHDVGYKYSTSLHWSLTQFTPASMEVVPANTFERAFNICVVIFALVLFSSFVSSITEAMAYLRHVNSKRNEQFGQVRKYFAENHVSMTITSRVWRYLEQSNRLKRTQMLWKDVYVFRDLPESLQKELRQEVYLPTILCHPFFQAYGKMNGACLRSICYQAVEETCLAPGQDLFGFGDLALRMYFVTAGNLEYFQPPVGDLEDNVQVSVFAGTVEIHNWASEAALWIRWFHSGWMVAQRATVLVSLDAEKSHRLMQQYSEALRECVKYARLFATNSAVNPMDTLSDLPADFDAAESLVNQAFTDEANDDRRSSGRSSIGSEGGNPLGAGLWGRLGGILGNRGSIRQPSGDNLQVANQASTGASSVGTGRRSSVSGLSGLFGRGQDSQPSSTTSQLMRGASSQVRLFMSKSWSETKSQTISQSPASIRGSVDSKANDLGTDVQSSSRRASVISRVSGVSRANDVRENNASRRSSRVSMDSRTNEVLDRSYAVASAAPQRASTDRAGTDNGA